MTAETPSSVATLPEMQHAIAEAISFIEAGTTTGYPDFAAFRDSVRPRLHEAIRALTPMHGMSRPSCPVEGCSTGDCSSCQRIADLEAQLAASRSEGQQDRERLDWLEKMPHPNAVLDWFLSYDIKHGLRTLRGAIDAARYPLCPGCTEANEHETHHAPPLCSRTAVAQPETET